jgi:hypothetical protein
VPSATTNAMKPRTGISTCRCKASKPACTGLRLNQRKRDRVLGRLNVVNPKKQRGSQDSTVSVVTGLRTGIQRDRHLFPGRGRRSSSSRKSRQVLGSSSPCSPFSGKVQNGHTYTSIPPTGLHGVHGDNLAFTLQ